MIFWNKFRKCIKFWTDFPRKIGFHRTTQPKILSKKYNETSINGGPIGQHTRQKLWGTGPRISLINKVIIFTLRAKNKWLDCSTTEKNPRNVHFRQIQHPFLTLLIKVSTLQEIVNMVRCSHVRPQAFTVRKLSKEKKLERWNPH